MSNSNNKSWLISESSAEIMSTNSSFGENSPCGSKWVTFDDLIDDAMESGKLSPRRNNNSQRLFGQQQRGQRQSRSAQMTRSQTFSTSSEERLQQKQQPIVILPPPPAVEKKRRSSSVVLGSSCGSYGYNSGGGSSGASPTNFAADLGEDAPVKSPLDFSQSMGSSSEEFQVLNLLQNCPWLLS